MIEILTRAIYFPSIDLEINPSNVAFSILGKDFYWYGIIIAVGFLLGSYYAMRRSQQFGLTQDNIIDMLICAVPTAIICARAYYVIFNWTEYSQDPISVLYIWEGGLAIYGGVIGSVLAVTIFCKVKKIKVGAMLDIGGLGLLIGQCIGRWGNFINREAYGELCNNVFRMGLMGEDGKWVFVHPTFLYESAWNLLGFVLLHFFSKKHRKFDGQLFLLYLAWYGLGRGFIEGLRTDSLYFFSTGLRVSQFLGFASFIVCALVLFVQLVFKDHDPADMQVYKFNHPELVEAADVAAELTDETNEKEIENECEAD